jgi:hypothetical protein
MLTNGRHVVFPFPRLPESGAWRELRKFPCGAALTLGGFGAYRLGFASRAGTTSRSSGISPERMVS